MSSWPQYPCFPFSSLVLHFSEMWKCEKTLLSYFIPNSTLLIGVDKVRISLYCSPSQEHFVIIYLVLHLSECRSVEKSDYKTWHHIGQISTPISTKKIIRHRGSAVDYGKGGFRLCQYILPSKPFSCNVFSFTSREMTQKCQQKQNNYLIPRISLLNLLCFVVEVR